MGENSRHVYEYEVELGGDSAAANVIRMVGTRKRVLEIGAGPGSITKHLKGAGECSVIALELDEDAIKRLTPHCDCVYRADLNDKRWQEILAEEDAFDVVVAADVLEHLCDPWLTLRTMKGLLAEGGYLVVSLPHVGHNAIAACLFDGDFGYRDWGLLDRTHIRFFGIKNMQALFNDAGLKIGEAQFVTISPESSEFYEQWKKVSPDFRKVLEQNRFGNVYQVVIRAVPATSEGENVLLEDSWVPSPLPAPIKEKVTAKIRSRLSPGFRSMLSRMLRRKRY